MLLANNDTYQRKKFWSNSRRWRNIGESPNRCCYHAERGVLALNLISENVQISIIGKTLKNSKPIYFVLCKSFVLCVRSGLLINPLRHQHVVTTRLHFCVSTRRIQSPLTRILLIDMIYTCTCTHVHVVHTCHVHICNV